MTKNQQETDKIQDIRKLELYRIIGEVSDGKLRETQTANYFSNPYPIDCAVPSVNA